MLEIKLTVEATELVNALNNLATAMGGAKAQVSTPQPLNYPAPTPPQSMGYPAPTSPPVNYPAPSVPVQTASSYPTPGVPLAQAPKFTTEQIMSAGAALVDAGRVQELMNLLNSFGVQAVTALKPEQLGAFATAMREMGASI